MNPYTRQQDTRVSGKEFERKPKSGASDIRSRRRAENAASGMTSAPGITKKSGAPFSGRGNKAPRPHDAYPNKTRGLPSRGGRGGQGLTDDGEEIKPTPKPKGRG